jgi:hypothetical protein
MRRFNGIPLVVALFSATFVAAADSTPRIGQGSTRQQVIEALGPPVGRANLGTVEILNYPNGQVRLVNGRVERTQLRPTVASPAPTAPAPATLPPKPVPAAVEPSAAVAKDARNPIADAWFTQIDDALRDATRRDSPILALFTRSDASPASRQFQKEIVHHPEFVNAFRANYVLLNLDSPNRGENVESNAQLQQWREKLSVKTTPALVLVSPAGERIAAVEISDTVVGTASRGRLITAIIGAYSLPTPVAAKKMDAIPAPVAPAPVAVPLAQSSHMHVAPVEISAGLTSARWFVIGALCVGTLISAAMLFVLWMVLRKANRPAVFAQRSSMASRIDHAASGLPSHAEILSWPKETLCNVVGRLAELEGFEAEIAMKGDKDIILRRPAVSTPEAIVCCVTGNAGIISTRRVRELVGTMAADDMAAGWFVAPTGFSLEARTYAEEQKVRLIDGARLLTLLSDLPSFALPKVLVAAR